MRLTECLLTENDCYKGGRTIVPKGVMVHSTGANNPNIRRYAQPTAGSKAYEETLSVLGVNRNGNDWNRGGVKKCVHAFVGLLADGSVGTAQTLPWEARGWHAGTGARGSANNTHIAFEICEDGLLDRAYFAKVYREAAELTAYLCERFGLDPLADGVVICHAEGHRRGIASDHVDVEHWWPRFGKSMDDFRRDVAERMEENMTGEEIYRRLNEYLRTRPVPAWAEKELKEAVALGITDGTEPMALIPRYQAAIMARRAVEKEAGTV